MRNSQSTNEINQQRKSPGFGRHVLTLIIAIAVALGAIGLTHEWIVVEKVMTALLMPAGLFWLGLFLVVYFSLIYGNRQLFLFSLLLWTLFGLASNQIVSDHLMYSLEQPYESIDPLSNDAFDYVIVLGGGSSYPISRREQFGAAGDRVAFAAQMYHAEKTDRIIVTGSGIESLSDHLPDAGELSRILLERLGVPPEVIETSQGRNTREEFANLATRFADRAGGTRIGLITSAWHLPRAMRLAKANDFEVEAIPADFRTGLPEQLSILDFIPGSGAFCNNSLAFKEYLAKLAGQ